MDGALLNMSCFGLPVCLLVVATPFSCHVDDTMLQLVLAQIQHAGIRAKAMVVLNYLKFMGFTLSGSDGHNSGSCSDCHSTA